MKDEEHKEQCNVISWFDMQYPAYKGKLAAVPNASKCPVWVGKKMNKEGRRKGYPDLQLLTPRQGYSGLIIEMKKKKGGTVSKEQREFIRWLSEQNFLAVVCKGFEEAQQVIKNYLK